MSLPSVVLLIVRGTLELACRLVRAVFSEGVRHAWKRAPLLLLLWCAIAFLNVLHIAGFVADAVLFHEFRRVGVKQPVFILGIPRSGTTFLHRVLAGDDRFSTLTTWEALLAPSIAERHVYRFLGRIFSPLDRLTAGIRRRLFGRMDVIHTIKLREAEEDFLLLLPIDRKSVV